MYKMEIKANERIFLVTMNGLMTEKESISYIEDLRKNIRSINPAQYSIVIDARELKVSPQNLMGLIEQAMALIARTPFKKRYSIMPESFIAFSQLKRIGREDNRFKDIILVESYKEVIELTA